MEYNEAKEEILKGYMKGKKKKGKKKKTSSEEEQGEIYLSCWSLPSDFFLDPSLVFYQLKFWSGLSSFW